MKKIQELNQKKNKSRLGKATSTSETNQELASGAGSSCSAKQGGHMPATGPEPFGAPLALRRGKPSPFRERKGNADGDGAFRRERVTALLGARATREGFGGATCGSVVQETERREIWGAGGFWGAGRRTGSANTSAMGDPSVRSTHSPSCWGIPAAPGHHPLPSLKDAGKGGGITDPQRPPPPRSAVPNPARCHCCCHR